MSQAASSSAEMQSHSTHLGPEHYSRVVTLVMDATSMASATMQADADISSFSTLVRFLPLGKDQFEIRIQELKDDLESRSSSLFNTICALYLWKQTAVWPTRETSPSVSSAWHFAIQRTLEVATNSMSICDVYAPHGRPTKSEAYDRLYRVAESERSYSAHLAAVLDDVIPVTHFRLFIDLGRSFTGFAVTRTSDYCLMSVISLQPVL